MKTLKGILITIVFFIYAVNTVKAQGCSDAGFCTINSLKPNNIETAEEPKNQLKFGSTFGKADKAITIFASYLEFNRQISKKFELDTKITMLAQNGNGISVSALADIYLNANYTIGSKTKLTVGTKIPFTDGNKTKNNLALPMDYQSSLGSVDLILGLGHQIENWQFVLALQQPLTQNKNQFLAEDYPLSSVLSKFQSTKNFKRSGDVLLRISYLIKLKNKLTITPGILPIYHLSNDKYTNNLGIEKAILGSQGLTLNANIYFDYRLTKNSSLQLNFGAPFLTRNSRPDGLTRSFVTNIEYRINF